MNIPSTAQCFKLIQDMDMMDHIIDHSVMVGTVALCLGRHLKKTFPLIDLNLTASAALLHDITKTRSLNTGEIHSQTGCSLMENLGYPEVGDVIRQHVVLDRLHLDEPVSEPEIVNYSDKRVLHDKVVSLDLRLDYIRDRYGTNDRFRSRINQMIKNTKTLERKLFRRLPFTPSGLEQEIDTGIFSQQGS